MSRAVTHVTWAEVHEMLAALNMRDEVVYGVPKNGMVLCAFLPRDVRVTSNPFDATVILDDLVDSGATKERHERLYPQARFVALFEKTAADPWYVFPWETETGPEDAVVRLLEHIGEDPKREGLVNTPGRVVRALAEMSGGMHDDPLAYLRTSFKSDVDEMVVVRDVPFSSLCEHHLLPFHGVVTLGYLPRGQVFGLSKLPRMIQAFARRLQLQENLTHQIADAVMRSDAKPAGCGVIVRAVHTCMSARGVRSAGEMRTSAILGSLRSGGGREEFLRLAGER